MEHTKTPYEVVLDTNSKSDTLILGGDDGMVADCYYHWRKKEERQANAEFIVRACNSHEAMLEALEDIFELLHPVGESLLDVKSYRRVLKAIALAKGNEGG